MNIFMIWCSLYAKRILCFSHYQITIYEVRMNNPMNPLPDVPLEQLPVRLRDAASRAGWTVLMPVQARGIPYLLAARNMMIQARTGSGKTGAFLLPMLERLDSAKRYCQALILVPTRELARQGAQAAQKLCRPAGLWGGR